VKMNITGIPRCLNGFPVSLVARSGIPCSSPPQDYVPRTPNDQDLCIVRATAQHIRLVMPDEDQYCHHRPSLSAHHTRRRADVGPKSDSFFTSRVPARCRGGAIGPCPKDGQPGRFYPATRSRKRRPGLNFACFDAAILIFSPVRGLRPCEAARLATVKVP